MKGAYVVNVSMFIKKKICTNENTLINKEKKIECFVNSFVLFILDAVLSMCIIIRYIMSVLFSVSISSCAEFCWKYFSIYVGKKKVLELYIKSIIQL